MYSCESLLFTRTRLLQQFVIFKNWSSCNVEKSVSFCMYVYMSFINNISKRFSPLLQFYQELPELILEIVSVMREITSTG